MAELATVIDVDDYPKVPKTDSQDQPKRTRKRRRASWVSETLSNEQREAQIKGLKQEMDGLYGYYKEVMEQKSGFGMGFGLGLVESGPLNSVVAVLMEESDLPLSRLVEAIHEKVKDSMGNVSLAAVKRAVLFVGQRVKYGLGSEDADILEDDSNSSLWCWETRDVKLMPKSVRATLKIRRTCRKKINERITAVSAMITLLQKWGNDQNYKHDFMQASEKLVKVLSEAEIRLLMCNMSQKSGAEMAEKEAKREEKLLIKQFERNRREIEREKKKVDRELQKEKLQNEKERKRLQEVVEKDERRREREEAEMRKQLRKQQEEVERDQRRREKVEAELKKQLLIQKQASLMERFLKKCKTSPIQIEQSTKPATFCPSTQKSEKVPEAITLLMDTTFSSKEETNMDDLRKLHLSSWHHLGHFLRSNQKQCWGMRRKPKAELFKALKLTANKGSSHDELSVERIIHGWGEENSDDRSCFNADISVPDVKCCGRKQLLQFDKSYRPAFFGIWPKKSNVVGPRCPLRKDPDLDYDVDSDEEWEEEEPGESLSDCDKDEEEESFEGCSKADDEDESEDGFFVPDGYLSENEGVQVDKTGTDAAVEETKSSPMSEQDGQNEEFYTFLRQQKYLNSLTEHALRKNQPLIILNISHEKTSVLMAEDLTDTCKLELTCLQALSMRACPDGSPVAISVDSIADDNQEACLSSSKASITPVLTVAPIPDSDMPLIVSTIQSCSLGINRLVESLQQKFPSIPKSQLKNTVREISEFSDNRWQVKKEILQKLGIPISPEKGGGRTKTIAAFFSKRCLPPSDKSISPIGSSPRQLLKPSSAVQEQKSYSYNHT
ncbi:chromatin assembly factor 1 subunit FAS1 [Herrania umbratica]|uniref:Chromatin assembly factor 1 subunit FAS1 n=1 Tax=Herrania umbratica TaxID=108875 RepID=A0A6J1AS83_9ROSI|nr:chromatin assembly factor 1 subunit FAS1 [Herrania umbratica]XP_021289833.1 chromatin assembly factor 1 subunit FAS1 [Herrania umbratica]